MKTERYLDKLWTMIGRSQSVGYRASIGGRDTRGHDHVFRVLATDYDAYVSRNWREYLNDQA